MEPLAFYQCMIYFVKFSGIYNFLVLSRVHNESSVVLLSIKFAEIYM